jgi:hypothetical protein
MVVCLGGSCVVTQPVWAKREVLSQITSIFGRNAHLPARSTFTTGLGPELPSRYGASNVGCDDDAGAEGAVVVVEGDDDELEHDEHTSTAQVARTNATAVPLVGRLALLVPPMTPPSSAKRSGF